ncbi:MAG: hypothetical protein NT096_15055 [Proteobacteria bacterium]|nr:hypothetical protein [Pseudomonadota bacterium]
MSRADMDFERKREDWMTAELEEKLKKLVVNSKISCAAAHEFCKREKLEMKRMKPLMDALGIKLKDCQLGCF